MELAVLVGLDEQGNWLGIAPFCVDGNQSFARKLRFLGSGTACTDYLGLICQEANREAFEQATFEWIQASIGDNNRLGRIDVIELEGITMEAQSNRTLRRFFEAAGYQTHSTELEGSWVVPLYDSWEVLNSSLSKSMRRKTRKAVKRIADKSSRVYSSDDTDFDEMWPSFVELHQQRRNMLGQAGCFADPRFERWLQSTTRDLIALGQAELVFIDFEDKPFATMLLFNDGVSVYMYQSGMDCSRLELEPGYQIAYVAIESSIRKGFKQFDFMRGDEPYKSRWNSFRIPLSRLRLIPPAPTARLKHGLWLAGRSLKNYMEPKLAKLPKLRS